MEKAIYESPIIAIITKWEEFQKFDYIADKPPQWLKKAAEIFRGEKILTAEDVASCIDIFGDLMGYWFGFGDVFQFFETF